MADRLSLSPTLVQLRLWNSSPEISPQSISHGLLVGRHRSIFYNISGLGRAMVLEQKLQSVSVHVAYRNNNVID